MNVTENMCQDHGVKYDSPVVLSTQSNIKNSDGCAAQCHSDIQCHFWEFTASSRSCRLISSFASASFVGGSNIISGVSPCPKRSDPCELKNSLTQSNIIYKMVSQHSGFYDGKYFDKILINLLLK